MADRPNILWQLRVSSVSDMDHACVTGASRQNYVFLPMRQPY